MRNAGSIITNSDSNLDLYPSRDTDRLANLANQITIGDLHGNALKLIYTLIRQNVLNVSEADYACIRDIYNKGVDTLTKDDLQNFNTILSKISANPTGMIRLIGDELADRGSNDLWTLRILKRLKELKVPVEVIISNHTLGFLDGHARGNFNTDHCSERDRPSMTNLKKLINKGLINKREVDSLAKETHQPLLKALSYSISPDGNGIALYSHAPIDLTTIEHMAKKLKIEYRDNSIEELAQTIDKINEEFQKKLIRREIFELFPKIEEAAGLCTTYGDGGTDRKTIPFTFSIWNRKIEKNKNFFSREYPFQRPETHKGYHCQFVHGHDSTVSGLDHIINLDNCWGKAGARDSDNKDYLIHYSQDFSSYREYQYQTALRELKSLLQRAEESTLKQKAQLVYAAVVNTKNQLKPNQLKLLTLTLTLTKSGLENPRDIKVKRYQDLLNKLPGKENWAKIVAGSFAAFTAELVFFAALAILSVFIISAVSSGIAIPAILTASAAQLTLYGTIGLVVAAKATVAAGVLTAHQGKSHGIHSAFSSFWKESKHRQPKSSEAHHESIDDAATSPTAAAKQ